jgi:hypothetical protein
MNENKCHCGAPAPWLATIRIVRDGLSDDGMERTLAEVSRHRERVNHAACDAHLAEAIRESLTVAPDKMEYTYLISVREPDDDIPAPPESVEEPKPLGWVPRSEGQVW